MELDFELCSIAEKWSYIVFLTNCFLSLETEFVRTSILKLVSLPLWNCISPDRRHLEFQQQPSLAKKWNRLIKKQSKRELQSNHESQFIPKLINMFLAILEKSEIGMLELKLCERFIAFLIDLLSQLPTRRFLRVLLQDQAIVLKSRFSETFKNTSSQRFRQLVDLLDSYLHFNVDDHTGEPLSDEEVLAKHYENLTQLQRLLFKYWNDQLKDFSMLDCATLQKPQTLERLLESLSNSEIQKLVIQQLKLIKRDDPWTEKIEFLKMLFFERFIKRKSKRDEISSMPIYPPEELLWDPNKVRISDFI